MDPETFRTLLMWLQTLTLILGALIFVALLVAFFEQWKRNR